MLRFSEYENKPLNINQGNGIVNIMNRTNDKFLMQDKIPVKTTSSAYTEALKGILEDTNLSNTFFSKENIELIQTNLKKRIYDLKKVNIDSQPENIIKVIMRNVFLQSSKHSCINIPGQIRELNKLVVNECTPRVLSGLDSFFKYQSDISTLAMPIDRPVSTYKSQKIEFRGFFKPIEKNNEAARGDLSKFLKNNTSIAENYKPLV